jgi:hypothetical protein
LRIDNNIFTTIKFNSLKTQEELFIKMVLDAWYTQVKRTDNLFNSLSDEQLIKEIAAGKNRGIYLLGHLTAVHDKMFPILGLGSELNPELYQIFVENPDNAVTSIPDIADLRSFWKEVNSLLSQHFNKLTPLEWFQKHNSVSEEDFVKEPHRNKLNLIINRTNHLASHLGQLLYLKEKNADAL